MNLLLWLSSASDVGEHLLGTQCIHNVIVLTFVSSDCNIDLWPPFSIQ